jgi:bacteriorhodopsin
MENQPQLAAGTKAGKAKLGFYIHLAVFVAVNALLIAINLAGTSKGLWFKWPLFGWGIGIAFHALAAFVFADGSRARQRRIARELKK